MLKALIVEDDKLLASLFQKFIEEKFTSDICSNGLEAIEKLKTEHYDLVIADSILPKLNALGIIRELKKNNMLIPIVVISFTESTDDKTEIMEYPMADYFLRNYGKETFLIMVDNLLQRFNNKKDNAVISYKNLKVDLTSEVASFNDVVLENIKGKYLDLLYFFVLNNNIILKKEEIFDRVWGVNSETTINAIEVYISGLRKELKKVGCDQYLKTIRGIGYSLS
ncbi:response regulator transcription factor [Gemella sp. GH3]|uniref:response regulator transcription factor n=1 Tax=unclassified Gemella TaxID=2624949 RepID=UPI0015D0D042|nr:MULTISPECIES: response regulator transcription factor [unclassified Gemella]MBF0713512.1 response regulator transcription factor [Gemella sp. GH3.1]NYS50464.1 response regulator transcription factor [Gemella sp. GH3]